MDWDWRIGEGFIGQAEMLVASTQGDRDLWKRGAKPRPDWARIDEQVVGAYTARDKVQIYVALMGAMADLPGLRALGRAVLFLRWRVVKQPQPQRRLLREAASFDISETTLERAKRRLRMESVRKGGIGGAGQWYIRRPTTAEDLLAMAEKAKEAKSRTAHGPQLPLPLDS